jgi:hypothetical protein
MKLRIMLIVSLLHLVATASAQTYTYQLSIQPILVVGSSVSGNVSGLSQSNGWKDAAQKVWDQAGIFIDWRPVNTIYSNINSGPTSSPPAIDNVYANVGNGYLATFDNLAYVPYGGAAGTKVINIWFINDLRGVSTGDLAGQTQGALMIVDLQGVGSLRTIAHEIGHSLLGDNLHTYGNTQGAFNLMSGNPTEPTSLSQIGSSHLLLDATQISSAQNSSLLTAIPEPSDFAVLSGLICGLAFLYRVRAKGSAE